jgi:pyroglutamyl-peptidase
MSATFLVTGFEPFGEHRTNSSWDALERLRERWPRDVATRRLPVDHVEAHAALRRALDELEPTAVLCTGLAKGRVFRIESCARLPAQLSHLLGAGDAGGVSDVAHPGDAAAARGPSLVRGRWPWEEMRRALEQSGVDVVESDDAGRYVCESTYWSLLTYAPSTSGRARPPFAGFLHVPHESSEYSIERIATAVQRVVDVRRAALVLVVDERSGVDASGGSRLASRG